MIDYIRFSTKEFPFWAMFCLFPFISITAWVVRGYGIVNYDYFWIPFCASMLLYSLASIGAMRKKSFNILLVIGILVFCKYIIPLIYGNISIKASIMDIKWVVYLLSSILWIESFGIPNLERIFKYCIFFCLIYIVKALFLILSGDITRAGVLMEANYDGYMILIVYCFSDYTKKRRWWFWIIALATLLTMSRTGWAAFFAILAFKIYKKNILYLLLFVPVTSILIYFGYIIRGESANNLDRFTYWEQAFQYFKESDITTFILGSTPGECLNMRVLPEFKWTIQTFERLRELDGIYPFMFHSTYLRLAFTWGIPFASLFLLVLIYNFFTSRYLPLKYLCLITIIQCFSLSALTLQNVSFLLFALFIVAWRENKQLKYQMKNVRINK